MRIQFWFRNWNELLIVDNLAAAPGSNPSRAATTADLVGGLAPQISNAYVWANYAIVSNDERKRMGCAPRDILMEQVQTAPVQTYTPSTNSQQSFDIRFAHAIKALFFAVRNTTTPSDWSNYTVSGPYVAAGTVIYLELIQFKILPSFMKILRDYLKWGQIISPSFNLTSNLML
jgi:hypothetical protein